MWKYHIHLYHSEQVFPNIFLDTNIHSSLTEVRKGGEHTSVEARQQSNISFKLLSNVCAFSIYIFFHAWQWSHKELKNCFFIVFSSLFLSSMPFFYRASKQQQQQKKYRIDWKKCDSKRRKNFIKNCFLVYSWWWFLVHALYANIPHTSLSVRSSVVIYFHSMYILNDNSYVWFDIPMENGEKKNYVRKKTSSCLWGTSIIMLWIRLVSFLLH